MIKVLTGILNIFVVVEITWKKILCLIKVIKLINLIVNNLSLFAILVLEIIVFGIAVFVSITFVKVVDLKISGKLYLLNPNVNLDMN